MESKDIAQGLEEIATERDALDAREQELVGQIGKTPAGGPVDPPAAPPAVDPPADPPPVIDPPATDPGRSPTLFPFDPTNAIRVGGEGDPWTPLVDGAVFYGAGMRFYPLKVIGGKQIIIGNDAFGGNPAVGVDKSAYVVDPKMVAPTAEPPPIEEPAPAPIDTGVPPGPPVAQPPAPDAPPVAPPVASSDPITIVTPKGETVSMDRTPGNWQKLGAGATLYARYYGENLLVLENGIKDVQSEDASGVYVIDGVEHNVVLRGLEHEPILLDGKMPAFTLTAEQVKAWEDANLIPHYGIDDPSTIPVDPDQTFETDGTAGEDPYMATTGGAGGIGYFNHKSVAALLVRSPQAIAAMIADAMEGTNWPVHYGDVDGLPIPLGKYPTWANRGDWTAGENKQPDVAHQPNLAGISMLVARANGSAAYEAFFRNEMLHWTSFTGYFEPPENRDGANHVYRIDGGSMQPRGCFHAVTHSQFATGANPGDPRCPGLLTALASTFEMAVGTFITGDYDGSKLMWWGYPPGAGKNGAGFLTNDNTYGYYPGSNASTVWEQGFLVGLPFLCRRNDLSGVPLQNAKKLRDFQYLLVVDTLGKFWQWMGVYAFPTSSDHWYTRAEAWTALFNAMGIDPMKADPKLLYTHDSLSPLNTFWTSYFGNFFQMLSQAVEDRYVSPVTGTKAIDIYKLIVGTDSFKSFIPEAPTFLNYVIFPKGCSTTRPLAVDYEPTGTVTPPTDPIPVTEPDPDPTPIVTEPADPGAGYLPTTVTIDNTDDLSASVNGSTFTMRRPDTAMHTLAYPPGGCIKIDPARAEVATPSGTGWRELPNTRLDSVMTAPVGGGYLSAALQNWTGWGWSGQLRLAAGYQGGGHNGNNNANWIGFDEKTLRPLEFFAPLPLTGVALGGSAGDKAPGPEFMQNVHWYGTQQGIIDARDGKPKFMHVGTSVDGSASIFDPMAGTIEKMAPYLLHGAVTTSDTDLGEDTTGFTAVFEPESKIYIAHSKGRANQLSHFEPGRNRWFGHGDETCWGGYWGNGNGQTSGFPGYNVIRLDPKRRRLVSMSRENGIGTLDLAWLKDLRGQSRPFCDFAYSTPRVDGVQPPETAMLSTIATFDYDDDNDDFLIYDIDPDNAGQGIVYSMHPETFAITVLERGGPPPNANGTWGRWWRSKARGEWFTVAGIDQNFWSFKRAR